MSRQISSHATPAAAKVAPAAASVMQLKCACGNRSVAGGECAACGKDKLQRKANGQAAMGAALSTPRGSVMQAKLAIGASDDPLEREADRVADQVLALPTHPVVRGAAQRIQRFAGQPAAQAATAPESVDRVLAGSGRPLDTALRHDMEQRFGHDFSRVRVHSDGAAGQSARDVHAHAYTAGHSIVFGASQYSPGTREGRRLLAHELTHVVQQTSSNENEVGRSNEQHGLSSDPFRTDSAPPRHFSSSAPGRRLQTQKAIAPPSPELEFAMALTAGRAGMTDADARNALSIYKKLSNAERQKAFNRSYPSGEITRLLFALKAVDAAGPYRDEVAEILRWVEEAETRKASGLTDNQMAEVQAKFKQGESEKEAQAKITAKTAKGVTPPKPSTKEVEEARKEKMEQTSIAPTTVTTWDKKSKVDKDAWMKRGETVIKALVTYAAKKHPDLKLAESHFLADFGGVEKRGQRVLAYGQSNGKGGKVAVFGFRFVEAAEANSAYVMSVVVHEVFGHPEYGDYGTEYHLALYDKAQAKMPGYTKPAAGTPERRSEIDAYAYQETEIYSLLRSFSYHTPIAAADAGKGLVSIDPASTVEARLGLIKQQWEPTLSVSIVRGLYQRLLQDPRITGLALNAFKAGVKLRFPAESKLILS